MRLRALGIKRMIMISGDHQRVADAVAAEVGIAEVHAECRPEDKVRILRELPERPVMMTGDGVNDAPVLDNNGNMVLTTISEDVTNPDGDLISAVISGPGGDRITDVDDSSSEGIAVTAVDNSNGAWQYATDGSTWTAFGSPSATAAVLLASDGDTKVRFVPTADYNGTVSTGLTFRAWDTTDGTGEGYTADVSTNGTTTSFSNATETAAVTITPVNDAPVANDDEATTAEDTSVIISVQSVLDNDTDIDTSSTFFTVTVISEPTHGEVQIEEDGSIKYTPDRDYNGPDSFTYTVSDGEKDSNVATVDVTTTPVNDAPVLKEPVRTRFETKEDVPWSPTVADVMELVYCVVGTGPCPAVFDPDSDSEQGLAIIGLESADGVWKVSTDGGETSNPVGVVSEESALLVSGEDVLSFHPAMNASSITATVTLRGWDLTEGQRGTRLDTTDNGGTTAFSTATDTASITVTSVNDAPVIQVPEQVRLDEGSSVEFPVFIRDLDHEEPLFDFPFGFDLFACNDGDQSDLVGGNLYIPDSGSESLPFVLITPGTGAWPVERESIDCVYPKLVSWVATEGIDTPDWYPIPNSAFFKPDSNLQLLMVVSESGFKFWIKSSSPDSGFSI